MAGKKGGREGDSLLFGKYRLLSRAGSGRTGTVWLALHIGLEEYRAIKCVPKSQVDYETFRREALILKELRHPGIPLVYDLEEDEEYFYLIEEYLEGYSLYALVRKQGVLQEAEAVRYGVQICSLVEYMHSACETPILHLDLQPNNLMICGGTVRLIDFDHAWIGRTENLQERYGTVGCAAPEQYDADRTLDPRTDIYAIGAVLRFMLQGTLRPGDGQACPISEPFAAVISRCMETDMDKRYAAAGEAAEALQRLLAGKEPEAYKTEPPSLTLVFAGSRPGAGTTHLAFGLCRYLERQGYRALYEEHSRSMAVRIMAESLGARADGRGLYRMKGCWMRPWYGPAAKPREGRRFAVVLKDFGMEWKAAARALKEDNAFFVGTAMASPWEGGQAGRLLEAVCAERSKGERRVLVFRHGAEGFLRTAWLRRALYDQMEGLVVFNSPEYRDPFHPGQGENFLKAVWERIEQSQTPCTEKRRKRWFGR